MSFTINDKVQIQNSEASRTVFVDAFQNLKVAEVTRLVGGNFEHDALDSMRWTAVTSNGGAVTVGDNVAILSAGTNSNGRIKLNSINVGRFISATVNFYLAGSRLSDTGTANNLRRWGVYDDNDGFFFQISGTTFGVGSRKNGVDTIVTSSFNGATAFVQNTNFHLYEIYFSSGAANFYQDRNLIHTISSTVSTITSTNNLRIGSENINAGNTTPGVNLEMRGIALSRMGRHTPSPNFYNIANVSETRTLKSDAGTLLRIVVNDKGQSSATISLYDGLSASGTKIATLRTVDGVGTFEYQVDFDNGLTYVTSTTPGDITIIFD